MGSGGEGSLSFSFAFSFSDLEGVDVVVACGDGVFWIGEVILFFFLDVEGFGFDDTSSPLGGLDILFSGAGDEGWWESELSA